MKVLLDENIDVRFKKEFKNTGHFVLTVRDTGWSGVKNGQLLKLMSENGFHVLIAVDKNLPYQHNQTDLPVAIIILDVQKNLIEAIKLLIEPILNLLDQGVENKVYVLTE